MLVTPKQDTAQKTVACHANTWYCGQTVFPVITKKSLSMHFIFTIRQNMTKEANKFVFDNRKNVTKKMTKRKTYN